jgi:O-antigen ligase
MIDRLHLIFPVGTFRSIQFWLTVTALGLAPLFFGSVDQVWVAIWTILLSAGVLCAASQPVDVSQIRLLTVFLAVCCVYALVAIVQVVPHAIDQLNDPIWERAKDLLGLDLPPRISGRAEISPISIGHFLLLVTSVLNGFFVGLSRRDTGRLVWFAQYAILLYAIYGLGALALTPNLLLWAPKAAYQGSLTATFVNHNTAATFIGSGVILWFCSAWLSLQSMRFSSLKLLLLIPSNEHIAFKVILRAAAGFICFIALLLTGSRGGLICSSLGLLVAIGLMIAGRLKPNVFYALGAGAIAFMVVASWLSETGRIGSEGLFDTARWSIYEACVEVIRQRPWFGAGAGTFSDLLPSIRSAEVSGWGVWDYAHSTILEIAVEMGLPIAAIIVVAAVVSLIILGWAAVVSKEGNRSLFSALTGIALLSYLHSLIDFSLQIPGYLIPFGIMLGCGLARASSEAIRLSPVSLPPGRRASRTAAPLPSSTDGT